MLLRIIVALSIVVLLQNTVHVRGNKDKTKISKEQLQKGREQLKQTKEQQRAVKLPPCAACRGLVDSFTHVSSDSYVVRSEK